MSEQELREIDRRVAVALGWRWRIHSVEVAELLPPDMHDEVSAMGFELSETPGSAFWLFSHHARHFTTDPAAADMVRLEIERRKWNWFLYGPHESEHDTQDGWMVVCRGERGTSLLSPHHALCLAFLAAAEAEKVTEPASG